MSGPTKDLFGGEAQRECPTCGGIHESAGRVRECAEAKYVEARREQARRFARSGVRQFPRTALGLVSIDKTAGIERGPDGLPTRLHL